MNTKEKLVPPKQPLGNIIYRKQVREWALKNEANRRYLRDACKDDFFFFLETFCWLYEPRPEKGRSQVIPFIPWEHQIPFIKTILEHLGYRDIGVKKSRGEGASWTILTIIFWRWLFFDNEAYGIVSRNLDLADKLNDRNSLGGKLDWMLSKLPIWLAGAKDMDWVRNISNHTWFRPESESLITAFTTTGHLAAGGRTTAFLLDEFGRFPRGDDDKVMSATEPVTNCRLLVSTFDGADGAFYKAMTSPSNMIKLSLMWHDNPTRNQDLFRIDKNRSLLLKPNCDDVLDIPYAKEFFSDHLPVLSAAGHNLEDRNQVWSPWLVWTACRAGMGPREMAQEYFADPIGASSSAFPPSIIGPLLLKCRQPSAIGNLHYDTNSLKPIGFAASPIGQLRLWLPSMERTRRPPRDKYAVGVDVATGTGSDFSSNTVISVVNCRTGEKVAEFASPTIKEYDAADYAIAMCRWFSDHDGNPAYLIWEANGPGASFRERVLQSDFRGFYYWTQMDRKTKTSSKKPGFMSTPTTKRALLSRYLSALQAGRFVNYHDIALQESMRYVYKPGGQIEFSGSSVANDPSGAGVNHGDRVIADALANFACEEIAGYSTLPKTESTSHPEKSFAGRKIKYNRKYQRRQPEW